MNRIYLVWNSFALPNRYLENYVVDLYIIQLLQNFKKLYFKITVKVICSMFILLPQKFVRINLDHLSHSQLDLHLLRMFIKKHEYLFQNCSMRRDITSSWLEFDRFQNKTFLFNKYKNKQGLPSISILTLT